MDKERKGKEVISSEKRKVRTVCFKQINELEEKKTKVRSRKIHTEGHNNNAKIRKNK